MCKMHYKNPFQTQDVNVHFVICTSLGTLGMTLIHIRQYCPNLLNFVLMNFPCCVFQMVTMKLRKPYTTASIWSSGKITCTGATSEDQSKIAARRYARYVYEPTSVL